MWTGMGPPRSQYGSGAGGFSENPSRFNDNAPGYRRPSPSAAPSGVWLPRRPRPSIQRDDYIEPGVGLGPGRGGPPARQGDDYIEPGVAEGDDYFKPGVSPGRYGAGRGGPPAGRRDDYLELGVGPRRYGTGSGGIPSGPGGDRDDYIEPGSERYGARNEKYHEHPYDESYGSAGYGRGGGESGSGRRGGYGRGQSAYGEDDYDRSGQGYGRGKPGHGRGGEPGYGRDESYGRGRGRGYGDESEFAPGPGRGGYGRGCGGYGEGGYTEEGYGRGRGGGKAGYEEDTYDDEAYGSRRPPLQAHPYAHLPPLASAHDEHTDPELFHQAAQNFILVRISHPSRINIQVEVLEQEANTIPLNLISRIMHKRMGTSENPQDKIIALAMSLAGKLFDKKNGGAGGGNPAAKVDAMHTAVLTAMRLCGQYTTTGRVNLEPGEMQNLMGAAMFLSK